MPTKRTPAKRPASPPSTAAKAKPGGAPRIASPADERDELRAAVHELALLTTMNTLMAQTAFLTVERLRISTEVVDERITNDFGTRLFEQCERMVRASDDAVLQVLDRMEAMGAPDPRAAAVRELVKLRREFQEAARPSAEQHRLLESMERMYR